MKQKLSVITFFLIIGAFLWVCTSSAIPPMPSSGTTYDGTGVNITATSANITTLTAANAAFTSANITTIKTAVAADNTLSGTPVIITVYDAASNTAYYFKAYPTKP
jgi:hypothetical protein